MAQSNITTEQVREAIEQFAAMVAAASVSPQTVANILEMLRNLSDQEKDQLIEFSTSFMAELERKFGDISAERTEDTTDDIRFTTNGGTLVGKIDGNGADFVGLKKNGQNVATTSDIPSVPTLDTTIGDNPSNSHTPSTKAVKDYIDAHGAGNLPIDKESTQSEDEEFSFANDAETQTYAKVGPYGVKSKAYLDMSGNDVIPTKDTSIGETPSQTNVPTSKAVADYVAAHGGGSSHISEETTQSEDEEFSFANDAETQTYAKVGSYGMKSKAYLDMQGNDLSNIIKRIYEGNLEKRRIAVKNKDKTLKILFLGNSYAERTTRLLPQLASNVGYEIIIGVSYIGGASLDTYYNQLTNNGTGTYKKYKNGSWTTVENTMMEKLLDEDWDYISLQQASSNAPLYSTYSHFEDDANLVFEKSPTIEYLQGWLMPWAWADAYLEDHTPSGGATTNATMFSQLASATEDLVDDYGSKIDILCPVGTAVENLTTIYTQQEVYYDNGGDGTHAGLLGYFAGTCVLFEQIVSHFTGKHLSDVTHTTALENADITSTMLTNCKNAAMAAISNPYEVTNLNN